MLLPCDTRAAAPTVSPETFDKIIELINERPDDPPELAMPEAVASPVVKAAELCRLERRDVVFSTPKGTPAPELGPDRSTYTTEKSRLPVLIDTRPPARAGKSGSALFVATPVMAVNIDGSPRAYHPRDAFAACRTEGSPAADEGANCGLNALCNGGVRIYDGARPIRCTARDDYQAHWDELWPLIEAGKAVRIPDEYWARDPKRSSDRRYGFFHPEKPVTVMFKDTIIPHDGNYAPCVRDVPGARYKGFFVGATSLRGREHEDEPEGLDYTRIVRDRRCTPIPFVNAETLPNIVIPKGGFADAKVGDLVVGYRREPDGRENWVYGIVGDEGPNDKFGEGSVAFNAALKGLNRRWWDSYRSIVRNLHIGDRNSKKERVGILILRGTANATRNDLSRSYVEQQSRRAFAAWGDGNLGAAKKRFLSCLAAME